jgi:phospholipid/cholesterol/gamma-HCH transport system substrate-binding protein
VQPAELNYTLNALATALQGRGEQLGETLDQLDSYLGAISDKLPTLRQDLVSLADVADTYDLAAPDLIDVLGNLTVTSKTVIEKADDLDTFFSDLQGLAATSTRILSDNEKNLIRVGRVTEPVLKLLAVYSPEFPCLIEGAAKYAPRLAKTFEGNQVKQYIEFGTPQYDAYHADDRPLYGEVGHGPWCNGLPNPKVPADPVAFKEGTDIDEHPPTSNVPTFLSGGAQRDTSSGYAGTEAEKAIVNALLAGQTGRAADSYGSLGSLLYGPVVRGDS